MNERSVTSPLVPSGQSWCFTRSRRGVAIFGVGGDHCGVVPHENPAAFGASSVGLEEGGTPALPNSEV